MKTTEQILRDALANLYQELPDILPAGSGARFNKTGKWLGDSPYALRGHTSTITCRADDMASVYAAMDAACAALAATAPESAPAETVTPNIRVPESAPADAPRNRLIPMQSEEGKSGWFFDSDEFYIDIDLEDDGTHTVYFRNRLTGAHELYVPYVEPIPAPSEGADQVRDVSDPLISRQVSIWQAEVTRLRDLIHVATSSAAKGEAAPEAAMQALVDQSQELGLYAASTEPLQVGRKALHEFCDKYCGNKSELVSCAESAFYWFNKFLADGELEGNTIVPATQTTDSAADARDAAFLAWIKKHRPSWLRIWISEGRP